MPKYHLVASYYDMFEKNPNLKYKNEVKISLPNIDLSTLQAIDFFTASHTSLEIFKIIKEQLGISGRNQLSIKYEKNKADKPDYYRVITNNPEFATCTKKNELIGYWVGDNYIKTLAVPMYSPLLEKEFQELKTIIETKDLDQFEQMFPYKNSNLHFLVTRYIASSYDTNEAMQADLKTIEKEFSRYKTFRGWIIAKEKAKSYRRTQTSSAINNQPTGQKPKETIEPQSIKKYAEEYQKEFDKINKDKGITYDSYQTYQYNTSHLEMDKEEFLEESEMSFLGTDYFEPEETYVTKKRRR